MSTAENDAVELSAADLSWLDSLPEGESSADHEIEAAEAEVDGANEATRSALTKSAWDPTAINIGEVAELVASGKFKRRQTEIMPRNDGRCLFYRRAVHTIYGSSGSGKSWVGLAILTWCLKNGMKCLYIDVEDYPDTAVRRLLQLGVTVDEIKAGFHYMRPDAAYTSSKADRAAWTAMIRTQKYDVILVDSYNIMLGKFELGPMDSGDIDKFMAVFAFLLADTGACVIIIDHIGKGSDTDKSYAYGSQAKKATATGCTYYVEAKTKPDAGRMGEIRLYIAKDRHGSVSEVSGAENSGIRHTATVMVDGVSDRDKVSVEFLSWEDAAVTTYLDSLKRWDKHKAIYGYVEKSLHVDPSTGLVDGGPSVRLIGKMVQGSTADIGKKIHELESLGVLENTNGNGIVIGSTTPPWIAPPTQSGNSQNAFLAGPVTDPSGNGSGNTPDTPTVSPFLTVSPQGNAVGNTSGNASVTDEEGAFPRSPTHVVGGNGERPDESPTSGWGNDVQQAIFAFVSDSIKEKRSKGIVSWWPSLETIVASLPYDEGDVARAVEQLLDADLLHNHSPRSSIEQFDVGLAAPPPWLDQPVTEEVGTWTALPDLSEMQEIA